MCGREGRTRQRSDAGSYAAASTNPRTASVRTAGFPPTTIVSLPVHTALARARAASGLGASLRHVWRSGSKAAPSRVTWNADRDTLSYPPHTISSRPVHTADCWLRGAKGAVGTVRHRRVLGLYAAPSPWRVAPR